MPASLALVAGVSAALYTLAPAGWYKLCLDQPEVCAVRHGDLVPTLAMVDAVNRRVNAAMAPRREPAGADVWTVGGKVGDCEDYALAKRAALIGMGVPSGHARIATGRLKSGEGHAVLIVTTDAGDRVLDNRTDRLRPLADAGFRIEAIQSAADPRIWLRAAPR